MLELINMIEEGISIDDYYSLIADLNCAIVEVNLPAKCKGFTLNKGGGHIVYINSLHSFTQKKKTLKHELLHIFNNHFNLNIEVKDKEKI